MNFRYLILAVVATAHALLALGVAAQATDGGGYRVKPGDLLDVTVWGETELQKPVVVAPDGSFSFPLVGHLDARGKTLANLEELVSERLSRYLATPVVTIALSEANGNKVYVVGQVARSGAFVMNPAVDVMQAISMAGGATPFAALDDIRILRRNGDEQVAFPFRYNDVSRGRNLQQNIVLQSGDIVVVP